LSAFTEKEIDHLHQQRLGRIATVGRDSPHVAPVGFRLDDEARRSTAAATRSGPEEVDSELLFERCRIAEIVVQHDAGVVDEDVERRDARSGRADQRRATHHAAAPRRPAPRRCRGSHP